jgi:hypothetical protein
MVNRRNQAIKIGFTRKDPVFREKTLQSEEPDVVLMISWPGTMQEEKDIHEKYRHRRLRGEWFRLTHGDLFAILFSTNCSEVWDQALHYWEKT